MKKLILLILLLFNITSYAQSPFLSVYTDLMSNITGNYNIGVAITWQDLSLFVEGPNNYSYGPNTYTYGLRSYFDDFIVEMYAIWNKEIGLGIGYKMNLMYNWSVYPLIRFGSSKDPTGRIVLDDVYGESDYALGTIYIGVIIQKDLYLWRKKIEKY